MKIWSEFLDPCLHKDRGQSENHFKNSVFRATLNSYEVRICEGERGRNIKHPLQSPKKGSSALELKSELLGNIIGVPPFQDTMQISPQHRSFFTGAGMQPCLPGEFFSGKGDCLFRPWSGCSSSLSFPSEKEQEAELTSRWG